VPPGHGEHDDHDGDQSEIRERISEIRQNLPAVAAGPLDDRAEDERRADGGNRQAGDQPVHPEVGAHVLQPAAEHQPEPDVDERVEREIPGVRERGDRDLVQVPERDLVVEISDHPGEQAEPDERPGQASLDPQKRPREAEERSRDQQGVVDEHISELVKPRAAEIGDEQGDIAGHASEQDRRTDRRGRPAHA
jgi:hypothetical protein